MEHTGCSLIRLDQVVVNFKDGLSEQGRGILHLVYFLSVNTPQLLGACYILECIQRAIIFVTAESNLQPGKTFVQNEIIALFLVLIYGCM